MTLLDAQALIALFRGEAAEARVRELLGGKDTGASAVSLAEVVDVLARRHGIEPARSWPALETLMDGALEAIVVDQRAARRAGELRAKHYHRRDRPLSMADCVVLACAALGSHAVASADEALLETVRDEGIEAIELPSA